VLCPGSIRDVEDGNLLEGLSKVILVYVVPVHCFQKPPGPRPGLICCTSLYPPQASPLFENGEVSSVYAELHDKDQRLSRDTTGQDPPVS
jgi:hypothetical protein